VALVLIFSRPKVDDSSVIIVLAPHYNDAALSVGGLLTTNTHPVVVATFFTNEGGSPQATENTRALKTLRAEAKDFGYQSSDHRIGTSSDEILIQEIGLDIQALLASYGDKKIAVYGPAIFDEKNTDTDHALLHQAYMNVAMTYPEGAITFYIYEDYPYIEDFNKTSIISLNKNLENKTERLFIEEKIPLSVSNLRVKEKALKAYELATTNVENNLSYTRNRCGNDTACEVVYRLFIATE
jgi:hypothetical protein